jgi:hypothetical protein
VIVGGRTITIWRGGPPSSMPAVGKVDLGVKMTSVSFLVGVWMMSSVYAPGIASWSVESVNSPSMSTRTSMKSEVPVTAFTSVAGFITSLNTNRTRELGLTPG